MSDRPDVVFVKIDENGNLGLDAVASGEALVTLTATMSRRYATRPEDAETLTDSVVFRVED